MRSRLGLAPTFVVQAGVRATSCAAGHWSEQPPKRGRGYQENALSSIVRR